LNKSLNLSLQKIALETRKNFLSMHYNAGAGHIGSGLSCIDLLVYTYNVWKKSEDYFILSKGHAASALYATLFQSGQFSAELIASYYKDGTQLPAHPAARAHPQIPAATGSLGHGFPIASGIAFASKILHQNQSRVTVLLSDGECDEGSNWEAALFSAHHKLDNLSVIIDANGLQGFGKTNEVINLEPFADKWKSFGFDVYEIDGHDFEAIDHAINAKTADKPKCIIARTVKGKGISFMESQLKWHYLPMTEQEFSEASSEISTSIVRLSDRI
jgi:transketolase